MAITIYKGETGSKYAEPLMDWANAQIFNAFGDEVPSFWIAGGAPLDFVRGVEPKDYDLWFTDQDARDQVILRLSQSGAKLVKAMKNSSVYEMHNAQDIFGNQSFGPGTYEIINHYFDSADDTIDFFDFTLSGIAVGKDFVSYHEKFWEHFGTKTLGFNSVKNPTNTLRRIPKYVQKGFLPLDEDLERLAEALQDVDLDDPEENVFKRIAEAEDVYGNMPMSTHKKLIKQASQHSPPPTMAQPFILPPPVSAAKRRFRKTAVPKKVKIDESWGY